MTAAVVLNYRTADRTIRAVRALEGSTSRPDPIIVVDNASGDGSVDRIREALGPFLVVAAEANLGFSGGCNLGIEEALRRGASRVLLLNSDVIVATDMLQRLEEAMESDPRLGIAGPVLLSADRRDVIESTGIRYSSNVGRMHHDDFNRSLQEPIWFVKKETDGVSGCAMLISRTAAEHVGALAEEFFFGFEDLDFCLRAGRQGFLTACIGSARAWHEAHASIGRDSPSRSYFASRNHLLLASRTPTRSALSSVVRTLVVVTLNAAHAIVQSEMPRRRALGAMVRGVADHTRRRYGPAPADLK